MTSKSTERTATQPTVKDLSNQFNTLTGSLAMLKQIGLQVLSLSEEYPDCEALSRLLATLRTEMIEARRDLRDYSDDRGVPRSGPQRSHRQVTHTPSAGGVLPCHVLEAAHTGG